MVEQQLMLLKRMDSHFITNKGARKSNQDVVLVKSLGKYNNLYLLADGMGGYKNGAYAANFITSNLYEELKSLQNIDRESIQKKVNKTTKALTLENEKLESKMGATLGGVIQSSNDLHCFWVGDVKIWHIKHGQIVFESVEHNLKNELIENKVFVEASNAKKYNHIVTRAIQNDIKKARIGYKLIIDFKPGDYILIASDGVTDVLGVHQLLEIVNSKQKETDKLSQLDDWLQKTAQDNYSLISIFQGS